MKRLNSRLQSTLPGSPKEIDRPSRPVPNERRLLADVGALMLRDLSNVEAGYYPVPHDESGGLAGLIKRSRAFFNDVPKVARRRRLNAHQEVFTDEQKGKKPRYYLQNFHYQTDGWLSEESADLYDFQVEVLFYGAAAAMRRQGLVPLAKLLREVDQRHIAFADIACGSGPFLSTAIEAYPRLRGIGIDLSLPYLKKARNEIASRRASYTVGKAEDLPLADGSLDVASIVYLFHELPPKIRQKVSLQIARVLKPGGTLIFVDSLQTGDEPDYDGLLELFPQLFHEPYYNSYMSADIIGSFQRAGLELVQQSTAFVSKICVFRKI
ncbi:MAG: class I SAM-dependent methyltransferase [Stappiaceae bacterium]